MEDIMPCQKIAVFMLYNLVNVEFKGFFVFLKLI